MTRPTILSTPLVIALMAFAIVGFLFLVDMAISPNTRHPSNTNTMVVACTDEAKICPDGSAVGRSGPDCEFAACPKANQVKDSCVISGCSGQLCGETQQVSDCMFRPEYACYPKAVCERQSDGHCGWTQTSDFKQCFAEAVAR